MEERKVLCWSITRWAQISGWFLAVGNLLGLIALIVLLFNQDLLEELWTGSDDALGFFIFHWCFLLFVTINGVGFGGLVNGIVLLLGVYLKNPCWLRVWYIHVCSCIFVSLILGIGKCVVTENSSEIFPSVLGLIFGLYILGFCSWVVCSYERELVMRGEHPCRCSLNRGKEQQQEQQELETMST